jgi:hypothetical protein
MIDAHVLFAPVNPRLWSYIMVLPPGVRAPGVPMNKKVIA